MFSEKEGFVDEIFENLYYLFINYYMIDRMLGFRS